MGENFLRYGENLAQLCQKFDSVKSFLRYGKKMKAKPCMLTEKGINLDLSLEGNVIGFWLGRGPFQTMIPLSAGKKLHSKREAEERRGVPKLPPEHLTFYSKGHSFIPGLIWCQCWTLGESGPSDVTEIREKTLCIYREGGIGLRKSSKSQLQRKVLVSWRSDNILRGESHAT